jgi:hypothetical protein
VKPLSKRLQLKESLLKELMSQYDTREDAPIIVENKK